MSNTASAVATPPKERVQRIFLFNGMQLGDPDPSWDPRKVKEHYAGAYPELLNATVTMAEGSVEVTARGRKETWNFKQGVARKGSGAAIEGREFKTSVGTKG